MELKDTPIYFSGLALIISIVSLYLNHLQRPKFKLKMGPEVHLFYLENGTSGIYVPFIILNSGKSNGYIHKAVMKIKDTNGRFFYFNALEFMQTNNRFSEYIALGQWKPFIVSAESAESKLVSFLWPITNSIAPTWPEGKYEITFYAWSKDIKFPDISDKNYFTINAETAKALRKNLEEKLPNTRYIYLNSGLPILSMEEVDNDESAFNKMYGS